MSAATMGELESQLAAAAAKLLFVSEGESPMIPVVLSPDASPESPIGTTDVRRRFAIPAGVTVTEKPVDEFFRSGTDPDAADEAAIATAPRMRALRDALRALAPDVKAFRVGAGAEVRYLVVGHARTGSAATDGAIVGVETTGYES